MKKKTQSELLKKLREMKVMEDKVDNIFASDMDFSSVNDMKIEALIDEGRSAYRKIRIILDNS